MRAISLRFTLLRCLSGDATARRARCAGSALRSPTLGKRDIFRPAYRLSVRMRTFFRVLDDRASARIDADLMNAFRAGDIERISKPAAAALLFELFRDNFAGIGAKRDFTRLRDPNLGLRGVFLASIGVGRQSQRRANDRKDRGSARFREAHSCFSFGSEEVAAR